MAADECVDRPSRAGQNRETSRLAAQATEFSGPYQLTQVTEVPPDGLDVGISPIEQGADLPVTFVKVPVQPDPRGMLARQGHHVFHCMR